MKKNKDLAAFGSRFSRGLTKREYFAGLAMQALISKMPLFSNNPDLTEKTVTDETLKGLANAVSRSAIEYADNLLIELGV